MEEQQVIDQVEKALDDLEIRLDAIAPEVVKTVNVVKNNPYILAGVALVGLATGAFAGYRFAKHRLELRYEQILKDSMDEAREFYSALNKEKYPTPGDAVRDLIGEEEEAFSPASEAATALSQYQGRRISSIEISEDERGANAKVTLEEPVSRNIFVNGKPLDEGEWDYAYEESKRTEDKPYVIHHDEFNDNEPDFEDMSLTFYAGDNVLADEKDEVVNDVEQLVGSKNLRKFGHGSNDKNVVYIRNNKRGLNIEVVRSSGKYAHEILGFDEEETTIQHSSDRRIRRPRGDDD